MTVTPDSPWREVGDTTVAGLASEFHRLDGMPWARGYVDTSPLIPVAAALIAVSRLITRLMAAQSFTEQKHATVPDAAHSRVAGGLTTIVPNGNHNFLSFKLRHTAAGPEWRSFPSYAACVAFWADRLLDPAGPYAGTRTIREFLGVYAPKADGNDEARYAREVCEIINRMPLAPKASKPASPSTSTPAPAPVQPAKVVTPGGRILNMKKGLIPYPPYEVRLARKVNEVGVDRLGPRVDRGDNWHRGLTGEQPFDNAVEWLSRPTTRGQTDFYLNRKTGKAVRMLAPLGGRDDWTPWAQGPWSWTASSADAQAFMALYRAKRGIDVSVWNADLISLEIDGDDVPISAACKQWMIAWSAAHWHDLGVKWFEAPIGPDGVTVLFSHREGCGIDYKKCGFTVVWTYINSDEFMSAVRSRMEAYQTGATTPAIVVPPTPAIVTPTWAPLIVPDFLRSQDPANFVDRDGTRYFLTTDQIRAAVATPRLQTANRSRSLRVGPDLRPGEDANASFIFTSREDGQVYYLSSYGTCLFAGDFERVSDQAAAA